MLLAFSRTGLFDGIYMHIVDEKDTIPQMMLSVGNISHLFSTSDRFTLPAVNKCECVYISQYTCI